MSELKLKIAVVAADKLIEERRRQFFKLRRELDNAETLLVEAREAKRKAEDELYEFKRTKVGDFSLEEFRTQQIDDYRSRMVQSLKKIENEPMLALKTMTDLDTTPAWPKSRYGND